jgi:hypothetical protein
MAMSRSTGPGGDADSGTTVAGQPNCGPAPTVPEAPWMMLLLVAGGGVAALAALRRRSR